MATLFCFFFLAWLRGSSGCDREREGERAQVQNLYKLRKLQSLHLSPPPPFLLTCCCQVFFQLLFLGVIFIFIFIFMGITIKCLGYLFDTLLEQFQLPEVISLSARGEPRSQSPPLPQPSLLSVQGRLWQGVSRGYSFGTACG